MGKDLSRQQFGILIALSQFKDNGRTKWLCQCRCGNRKAIREDSLVAGRVRSCGCISKQLKSAKKEKKNSLVNQRFGRLMVLWRAKEGNGYNRLMMWECKCDCGNLVTVAGSRLRSGNTKSCGCLRGNNG